MKELKEDRFCRVAEARVNKAIKMIRLIGNCSMENVYEYTPEQVSEIFSALQKELNEARLKYICREKVKKKFSLSESYERKDPDASYPSIFLDLPDGTCLRATADSDGEYPSIDVYLVRNGSFRDEKLCFIEHNKDRDTGKQLCVGCYLQSSDEPAFYESYQDEKENENESRS